MIQQVVDVFELKCVPKTFCGCLRFVSFHMYLTNTQLLSSLCLASLHFPLHITGNVTASSTQGKHSLFSRSSFLLYYLFCLAFYSWRVGFSESVYQRGCLYYCVVISLFFSHNEYEDIKIDCISTYGGGTSSYVAHHNAHE